MKSSMAGFIFATPVAAGSHAALTMTGASACPTFIYADKAPTQMGRLPKLMAVMAGRTASREPAWMTLRHQSGGLDDDDKSDQSGHRRTNCGLRGDDGRRRSRCRRQRALCFPRMAADKLFESRRPDAPGGAGAAG